MPNFYFRGLGESDNKSTSDWRSRGLNSRKFQALGKSIWKGGNDSGVAMMRFASNEGVDSFVTTTRRMLTGKVAAEGAGQKFVPPPSGILAQVLTLLLQSKKARLADVLEDPEVKQLLLRKEEENIANYKRRHGIKTKAASPSADGLDKPGLRNAALQPPSRLGGRAMREAFEERYDEEPVLIVDDRERDAYFESVAEEIEGLRRKVEGLTATVDGLIVIVDELAGEAAGLKEREGALLDQIQDKTDDLEELGGEKDAEIERLNAELEGVQLANVALNEIKLSLEGDLEGLWIENVILKVKLDDARESGIDRLNGPQRQSP